MAVEREFKLTADRNAVLPDLTDAGVGIAVGEPTQLHLTAIYYDTPSLAMARSGVTLRSRTGEDKPVWTLKLPDDDGASGLSRAELTFSAPLGPVPSEARFAARGYVRGQQLGPVVRLHTERAEYPITMNGQQVATLVDDAVEAEAGAAPACRFREIEIELDDENGAKEVRRLVDDLRHAGFCDDAPMPKAIRALGEAALAPPDVPAVAVGKRSTVDELVRSAISNSVRQLVDHHAGVWLGLDVEDVHQFRVATRRLRSDLRTFAPLLDEHWTNWLRDELRWLGGEVGTARDADVLAQRLRGQMQQLPRDDSNGVVRLELRLAENSADARRRVIEALSSDRYVALLDALVDAARQPRYAPDREDVAARLASDVLVKFVRKPWRKLRKAADALTSESPDAAFHGARIRAKKARYAAEAVVPVFGSDARQFAKAVERLQSVLGDHQDTAVAEAWLLRAGRQTPATRLIVGELITIERLERLRLRHEFTKVWKKASRHRTSRWLR